MAMRAYMNIGTEGRDIPAMLNLDRNGCGLYAAYRLFRHLDPATALAAFKAVATPANSISDNEFECMLNALDVRKYLERVEAGGWAPRTLEEVAEHAGAQGRPAIVGIRGHLTMVDARGRVHDHCGQRPGSRMRYMLMVRDECMEEYRSLGRRAMTADEIQAARYEAAVYGSIVRGIEIIARHHRAAAKAREAGEEHDCPQTIMRYVWRVRAAGERARRAHEKLPEAARAAQGIKDLMTGIAAAGEAAERMAEYAEMGAREYGIPMEHLARGAA